MTLVSCQVKKAKKPLEESSVKKNKLPRRIAIGIALGVLVGWACHHFAGSEQSAKEIASYFSMVTDIFLRMIKMIIAPLVFATLVGGIASMGNSRSVGRIGLRAMAWFVTASVISLAIGMGLVNLFQPGAGLNMEVVQHAASPVVVNTGDFSLKVFISHVFPRSIAEAMANNEILQIVVFSLFFGFALAGVKRAGYTTIVDSIEELAKVMFKVTDFVMAFAPIGVFAAIASAITTQGLGLIVDYGKLIAEFYLGIVILWCVLFAAGYLFLGRSVFTLGKLIREPVLLAFSTASSESAYPKTMEALEKFGAPKRVSSFVLPLGYSFNLDGSMMYQAFAIMFIAQAYNVDLSFTQQLLILLTLMITSKGMAGVARASVVVVAATLPMFNLPEAGILLILGIDQFLDMARTATNVVGNSIATAVVAKSEPHEEAEEAPGTKSPLPIHTAATA
nr:dicarboxylate/amino acid:cation symporter [Pseudomonas farris]